jgi:hypothetical protein
MVAILKIIELALLLVILFVLVLVVIVGSEEKKLYEDCNYKILCENNRLSKEYEAICQNYKQIQNNFTIPILS